MAYVNIYNGEKMIKMKLGYISGIVLTSDNQHIDFEKSYPFIEKLGTSIKSLYVGHDLKYGDNMTTFASYGSNNNYYGEYIAGKAKYTLNNSILDLSQLELDGNYEYLSAYLGKANRTIAVKSCDGISIMKENKSYSRVNTDMMIFATDVVNKYGNRVFIALYENKKTVLDGIPIDVYAIDSLGYYLGGAYRLDMRTGSTGFLTNHHPDANLSPSFWYYSGTENAVNTLFMNTSESNRIANCIHDYDISSTQWYFKPPFFAAMYGNTKIWEVNGFIMNQDGFIAHVINADIPNPDDDPDIEPDDPDPDNPDPNPDDPPDHDDDENDVIPQPTPSIIESFASKLITAYKLNVDNLNSLANEMWTENFLENFTRLFASPMDCLISLSEYPFTVPSGNQEPIVLGNVELETTGSVIINPMVTLDFGSVSLLEYWNNFLDYTNTKLEIFLPFIGFEQISINYMNAKLTLTYNVDVISGNCVAILSAISYRNNLNSVIGQWNGNCNYQIPLSGRDYTQMVSALWNTAGSVITGGLGAKSLVNLGNNIINTIEANNAVTTGGRLSANSGFLSMKTPYIIITRPQAKINNARWKYQGKKYNGFTSFNSLKGYTEISECELIIPDATRQEIEEIQQLLMKGVYF